LELEGTHISKNVKSSPTNLLETGKFIQFFQVDAVWVETLNSLEPRRTLEGNLDDFDQHLHRPRIAEQVLLDLRDLATLVQKGLQGLQRACDKLESKRSRSDQKIQRRRKKQEAEDESFTYVELVISDLFDLLSLKVNDELLE